MNFEKVETIWWENITGPAQVVHQILEALSQARMAVLHCEFPLPFRSHLLSTLLHHGQDKSKNHDLQMIELDFSEYQGKETVGLFFLEQVCAPSLFNKYRSAETVASFLKNNQVLSGKFLWIQGFSEEHQKNCQEFFRTLPQDLLEDCYLLLEWDRGFPLKEHSKFQQIYYQDLVQIQDTRLFSHLYLQSSLRENSAKANYFSCLSSHLAQNDGELALFFLTQPDFFQNDVLDFVHQALPAFTYGQEEKFRAETHLCFSSALSGIQEKIWRSQLEVLFPLIELHYLQIMELIKEDVEEYLSKNTVTQFNEVIREVGEVELGTLSYIYGKMPQHDPVFHEKIFFLRNCRNLIAHGKLCSVSQIEKLFNFKV